MIVWRPGQGCSVLGCGTLLLISVAVALLVYAISGGHCVVFVAP